MVTEFELIFEEFSTELNALSEMTTGPSERLTSRARIAAGNAATLLLAAIFEEYIRQQVRAAFKEKVQRANSMADFPSNLALKVWKRTLEMLARTPVDELDGNSRGLEDRFSAAVSFSVKKELSLEVSDAVSHNENNMRPTQLNELFKQIGVSSILNKSCTEVALLEHLGCDVPENARTALVSQVEDFFRRRNDVAHAITLGSSSGPSEIASDIEMFLTLGQALFKTLEREFPPQTDSGP